MHPTTILLHFFHLPDHIHSYPLPTSWAVDENTLDTDWKPSFIIIHTCSANAICVSFSYTLYFMLIAYFWHDYTLNPFSLFMFRTTPFNPSCCNRHQIKHFPSNSLQVCHELSAGSDRKRKRLLTPPTAPSATASSCLSAASLVQICALCSVSIHVNLCSVIPLLTDPIVLTAHIRAKFDLSKIKPSLPPPGLTFRFILV